jgi:hypothetical protein
LINQLDALWLTVAAHASPGLQTALMNERGRFNGFQGFAGKDFSQWAGMLQLSAPNTPWLYLSSPRLDNGHFIVEANMVPGQQLSLWRTADLVTWEPVPNAQIQIEGAGATLTDPAPAPQKLFYQVRGNP